MEIPDDVNQVVTRYNAPIRDECDPLTRVLLPILPDPCKFLRTVASDIIR